MKASCNARCRDWALWHFLLLPFSVLFVGVVTAASSPQVSDPFCACIDLEPTEKAVQQVSREDWGDLDEADLTRVWPEASPIPCEGSTLSGSDALTEAIERCCSSCGTCGGPHFDPNTSSTQGLRNVHVSVCRANAEGALTDLKRLVDATLPDEVDALYEEGWAPSEETGRTLNAYRWRSHGETFELRVLVGPWEDSGYGAFDLVRCDGVPELERWVLEDGTAYRVTEAEVRTTEDGERQFWFAYDTQCVIDDYECLKSEWRILWPRLRLTAEREGTSVVFLSPEACSGSMTVYPRRNAVGKWKLPW